MERMLHQQIDRAALPIDYVFHHPSGIDEGNLPHGDEIQRCQPLERLYLLRALPSQVRVRPDAHLRPR